MSLVENERRQHTLDRTIDLIQVRIISNIIEQTDRLQHNQAQPIYSQDVKTILHIIIIVLVYTLIFKQYI